MSAMLLWQMTSAGGAGFTLASIGDGVFSPASVLTPASAFKTLFLSRNDETRRVVVIRDIYINSANAHDLNLFYRASPADTLPSVPSSTLNDTLIYAYTGRTNCNPFHQNDDGAGALANRLTPIVTGPFATGQTAGTGGTLQFQVPPVAGQVKISILYSIVEPGGAI